MNLSKKISWLLLLLTFGALLSCSGDKSQSGDSRRGKTTGKVLLADQAITSDLNDQGQPAVAFDSINHQYLTVWTDSRNEGGSTEIYGRISFGQSMYEDGKLRFDNTTSQSPKTGTPPMTFKTADIRISDAPAQHRNQRQPKVAFYADTADKTKSKYLVVWSDSRNGTSQIYGQFLKTDGSFLLKDGVTPSATPNNFPITEYSAGTGPGTVAVSGSQSRHIDNGTISIEYDTTTVNGAGTTFLSSGILPGDLFVIGGDPRLVQSVESDTSLTLTAPYKGYWYTWSTVAYRSFRYLTPGNTVIGTGTKFKTDPSNHVIAGDMIGIDGVYYKIQSVDSDTQLTLTTNASQSFTGSGLPYKTTAHTNQSDPDIICNPVTKKFVVAWVDTSDIDSNYTLPIKGTLCSNQAMVNIVAHPASDDNVIKSVEINPENGAIGVKNTVSGISSLGEVSEFAYTLFASWNVQLSESKPKLSFNASTGETYLAWIGINSLASMQLDYSWNYYNSSAYDGYLYCLYESAGYTLSDTDLTTKLKVRRDAGLGMVKDYSFGNEVYSPALAFDPNTNRLLLAWEENARLLPSGAPALTGKDIQGQLLDVTSFMPYGNKINISTAIGDQTSPAAAFDNVNQRFLIAWEDARNESANISNIDIFGQFIDPQGNLSGGNTIITVASGNQLAPAVAFGDVYFRKFLTVWKDGRLNSNADIVGQLLEYSALPQLVITDMSDNPIFNSAIDFGNVDI